MESAAPRVIVTQDGSHSLLNESLNETYHSVNGAKRESEHVFISMGINHWKKLGNDCASVLEIGFGTGLNALLTLQFSRNHNYTIRYESLEAFPLTETIWNQLNYGESLGMQDEFVQLHQAPWNAAVSITEKFLLIKRNTTVQLYDLAESVEIIYYDAFAPSKQPEMWTYEILRKVTSAMKPGGIFVTYCAKGQLKRDLASLGLRVETLPGPPGKKEMVRATKGHNIRFD